jgi:flagellar basal-body rod protein FlgB
LEPLSTEVILKALDGLSARATVTAQNVANANSPGYRPLKVSFEAALREAAAAGNQAVHAVLPQIVPALTDDGRSDLRLDLELATMSSTAGRYGSLVEILNRQLQIGALAVSGSR